ncbi:MAG: hypothetical protein WD184_10350 [Acidimicrobiia bacterium]
MAGKPWFQGVSAPNDTRTLARVGRAFARPTLIASLTIYSE